MRWITIDPSLSQQSNSMEENKNNKKTPSSRGPNYTDSEDLLVVKAWQKTSEDAAVNTDRNSESFWDGVKTNFDALAKENNTTNQSLNVRRNVALVVSSCRRPLLSETRSLNTHTRTTSPLDRIARLVASRAAS